jgi:hypothetical protein
MAGTYPTIKRVGATAESSKGTANSTLLTTTFSGSPLIEMDADEYKASALALLIGADPSAGGTTPTKSYDFPDYTDRTYSDAPEIGASTEPDTTTDKIGRMYHPNIAAPYDAADPKAVGEDAAIAANGYPFMVGAGGDGALANPSEEAAKHGEKNANAQTIGQYILGTSA